MTVKTNFVHCFTKIQNETTESEQNKIIFFSFLDCKLFTI